MKNKNQILGNSTLRINKVFTLSAICSALLLTTQVVNASSHEAIPLSPLEDVRDTFATAINNNSVAITAQRVYYNFPVDYVNMDYDVFGPVLEDQEAVEDGDISIDDQNSILAVLSLDSSRSSLLYQKIGTHVGSRHVRSEGARILLADTENPDIEELTWSTNDVVSSIANNNSMAGFGTSPYLPFLYEREDALGNDDEEVIYWLREFERRAFAVVNGNTVQLPPPNAEDTYGGYSVATDINDNNTVVGYASVRLDLRHEEALEDCEDLDAPEYACYWTYLRNVQGQVPQISSTFTQYAYPTDWNMFEIHAYMWKLDSNGDIIRETDLGVVADRLVQDDPDNYTVRSMALAVNNNDIAVGYSDIYKELDKDDRRQHGAVFIDGEIAELNLDHDEYFASFLYDINDDNIAVGHAFKRVNGFVRPKFFYVDLNRLDLIPTFPDDFFPGSASMARAINNNGQIVGEFEATATISGARDRHGFVYDINLDIFQDINKLLPCDRNYTVVEARGINDQGEMVVSATGIADMRDSFGEPLEDEDGNIGQFIEPIYQALKVVPSSDPATEVCDADVEKNERKGASVSMTSLLLISLFGIFRRSKIKQK